MEIAVVTGNQDSAKESIQKILKYTHQYKYSRMWIGIYRIILSGHIGIDVFTADKCRGRRYDVVYYTSDVDKQARQEIIFPMVGSIEKMRPFHEMLNTINVDAF